MLTFKQFLNEYSFDSPSPRGNKKKNPRGITQTRIAGGIGIRGQVFRSDPGDGIPKKSPLRTYRSNANNTESGGVAPTTAVHGSEKKTKGLYAVSHPGSAAPYTGIARDEPRAWDHDRLYVNKSAKTNIPSTISAYKGDSFKTLRGSGERFSSKPRQTGSTHIQNPSQFRKAYRQEKRINNVDKFVKRAIKRPNVDLGWENI